MPELKAKGWWMPDLHAVLLLVHLTAFLRKRVRRQYRWQQLFVVFVLVL